MKTTSRKTHTSVTLQEVWAIKQAAQEETAHLTDPGEYFRYIHERIGQLNLPTASAPRRRIRPLPPSQGKGKKGQNK